MGLVSFWRIANMFVRFTCVFQHRTKYGNRCCKYFVLWGPMLGWCGLRENDIHVHIRRSNPVYISSLICKYALCRIIRKVTRNLNKPERKGWPLGKARTFEEKKSSRKKKSIVSKLLKSKGTPARDPEKARTRQEKKTCLKKMEINTFTWEKNVTEYFCKSFDGICFCPVLSLRSRSHYTGESLNTAFSLRRNINCSVHYVHSTLKTQQSPVTLDLFWENSATEITWLSRGHCLIGFLNAKMQSWCLYVLPV